MAATTMKTKHVDEDREYVVHECVCDVCHGKFTKKQYDSGQICSPSTDVYAHRDCFNESGRVSVWV